jgi:RNA-directed DNA polymerase
VYDRRTRTYLARFVADAFLAGVWTERAMAGRVGRSLDRRPRWVQSVAREVVSVYPRAPTDRPRELAAFIALALEDRPPDEDDVAPPQVRRWLVPHTAMGRRRWPVPELATAGALAKWLDVSVGELAWLADARGLERVADDERLRNYVYRLLPRRGGLPRVIERPKSRLKAIQRRLLHEILDWIPVHDAAHGFTRGRSAVTHAGQHTGQFVVVRLDLEDFFASITGGRVFGIFRTAGYPESVAYTLTALCTNVVAVEVSRRLAHPSWAHQGDLHQGDLHHGDLLPSELHPSDPRLIGARFRLGRRLASPHLPQGAPTSPALANLAAFRLDRRLTGLAGALHLTYTRYADDLTLSGSARMLPGANRLRATIAQIAREEGFSVNERKSTLMTRAGRQQVCGVIVNEHPNVARAEYDTLKAILHNAANGGAAAQNRAELPDFRAHLLGRIAWVEQVNPRRGAKLRRRFAAIAFDPEA